MSYFKNFPTIYYNGQQAKNLLARAALTPETKTNLNLYYPYTIKESDGRTDNIAYSYYDNSQDDWLIYFANETIDPYYGLGLDQYNFDMYITKKYGSIEKAQNKIEFYRTNWEVLEDSSLTVSEYEILDSSEKKYWKPILDIGYSIIRYERKQQDLIINTNKVYELKVNSYTGSFIEGEKIYSNSSIYGYCLSSNSSSITVNHITGINTSNIISNTLIGQTSNTSCIVNESILLVENIDNNIESKYWKAVTAYDNELEINTLKRNIKLIDKRYKNKVEDQLKQIMRK